MPTAVVVNSLGDFIIVGPPAPPPAMVGAANPGTVPAPALASDLGSAPASGSAPPVDPNQILVVILVAPPVPVPVVTLRMALDQILAVGEANNSISFAGAAASGKILLNSALPNLSLNISIVGTGEDQLTVMRDGAAATKFNIFTVMPNVSASISGLSITGGDNTGSVGGGILNAGDLTLTDDAIFRNTADSGGGIANGLGTAGSLSLNRVSIIDNMATNGVGGGILNSASLTMTNSVVQQNSASVEGGGLSNGSTAQAQITDSTFLLNYAAESGGGIYNNGALLFTGGALFYNWTGAGGKGGGMATGQIPTATATFDDVSIANNTATGGSGGGIWASGGNLALNDCSVTGNQAAIGAGMTVETFATTQLINCTITDAIKWW